MAPADPTPDLTTLIPPPSAVRQKLDQAIAAVRLLRSQLKLSEQAYGTAAEQTHTVEEGGDG